jgi:hypothetical protein
MSAHALTSVSAERMLAWMVADTSATGQGSHEPPKGDSDPGLAVRNETARKVLIRGDGGLEIVLAPFDERRLSPTQRGRVDEEVLRSSRYLSIPDPADDQSGDANPNTWLALLGLLVWAVPIWAIVGGFVGSPGYWQAGVLGIVGFTVVMLAGWRLSKSHKKDPGAITSRLSRAVDWTTQQVYLGANVAIGVLLPAAVIIFSAQLLDVVDTIRSAEPGADLHPHVLTLVGRALQLVFIAVASLLPALLFFLFDREQLSTQRDRFMRQIVRFDGSVETRAEILAKYGHAMEEAYGPEDASAGRLLPGRRSPVLVATVVMTLGWVMTLAHADAELLANQTEVFTLLEPPREPEVYAFLGAYVYALGTVLRGYVRKDLRPKTYSHITVRIILVIVLAWVLELQWSGDALLTIVFVAGLVPETAFVLINESLRSATKLSPLEEEPAPLTKLEGIDLYDRARLMDEGVTSVEGLAHHDVPELMLQTRIHAPQLVDWVDQAILYLHAGPDKHKDHEGATRELALAQLRAYGIRTATDLVTAVELARKRHDRGLDHVLPPRHGDTDPVPPRIQVIHDVICDEEWMPNLRRWHSMRVMKQPPHEIEAPRTAERVVPRAPAQEPPSP